MARLTDSILGAPSAGVAYSKASSAPMLDLAYGGQNGWSPNLIEWVSNQAYVRQNLICLVLEVPRLFTVLPDSAKWVQAVKSMMELHVRTIEGFNAGLTVEVDEHPVGGAGEFQQEVIDVKRARSEPVFGFVEKYGRPIQTLLDYWIRYGLKDPDTKYALAGILNQSPSDMLADWYSMTCMFIEPDPTHSRAVQAWLTTNMYPRGTGDITGKRDLTAASELNNLSIEFAGISQYGAGVTAFANRLLGELKTTITHADPFMRPAFVQNIAADVDAANNTGYKTQAATVAKEAVNNMS